VDDAVGSKNVPRSYNPGIVGLAVFAITGEDAFIVILFVPGSDLEFLQTVTTFSCADNPVQHVVLSPTSQLTGIYFTNVDVE